MWRRILFEKEFIGVAMEINNKIAVQRGGIMVYSGINWLTRSVKGRGVKALMYISIWRRDKIGKPVIEKQKAKKGRIEISRLSTINLRCSDVNVSTVFSKYPLAIFLRINGDSACKNVNRILTLYIFITFSDNHLHY